MLKPLLKIALAATGLFAVGALLLAQSGKRPGDPLSPRVVLVAQAASKEEPHSPSLSKFGWIGLMLQDDKGHGIRVTAVFPGGPAAAASVRVGDTLVRVSGTDLNSTQDAEKAIERLVPRQQTSLSVQRAGKTLELKVIPESLADFKRDYAIEMMRRDPRDPNYAVHHGVSEADMSAELVRRLFEQHERLERSLNEVLKELHALRKQVADLKK